MNNIKKVTAFICAVSVSAFFCGCGENKTAEVSTSVSSGTSESSSELKAPEREPLSDEQKQAAEEAGISEDRYCTDNTFITDKATELLNKYYEGITEADHDKCFDTFPPYYKKAMEDENKTYGETNEEYMQSIKDGIAQEYGDDFYIFPSVTSVLQINDESLKELQSAINESFSEDIVLDDLYYVYFSETVRGSLSKNSSALRIRLQTVTKTQKTPIA